MNPPRVPGCFGAAANYLSSFVVILGVDDDGMTTVHVPP